MAAGRRTATIVLTSSHAALSLIAGLLFFFFVLPRWPELNGTTSHALGTGLRIVSGVLLAAAGVPALIRWRQTRRPEFATPQLALTLRAAAFIGHFLAGALIIGTATAEIWLSLDRFGSGSSGRTARPGRSESWPSPPITWHSWPKARKRNASPARPRRSPPRSPSPHWTRTRPRRPTNPLPRSLRLTRQSRLPLKTPRPPRTPKPPRASRTGKRSNRRAVYGTVAPAGPRSRPSPGRTRRAPNRP